MVSTRQLPPDKARVDFERNEFDVLVRQKGYKVLWSAAELCPCRLNSSTDQADPSCDYCGGGGFFYTFPDPGEPTLPEYLAEGHLDLPDARATQAVVTQMTNDPQIYERFGEWISGTANLTTFSFHRVGYRDRFRIRDATQVYRQIVKAPESGVLVVGRRYDVELRYPVVKVRRVFEIPSGGAPRDLTEHAEVQDDGTLKLDGVTPGRLLSISYEMNPTWVVIDFPMAVRATLIKHKTKRALGEPTDLPQHAFVRLDYLLEPGNAL